MTKREALQLQAEYMDWREAQGMNEPHTWLRFLSWAMDRVIEESGGGLLPCKRPEAR